MAEDVTESGKGGAAWWKAKAGQVHTDLFRTTQFIRHATRGRRDEDVHHLRLATNDAPTGNGWGTFGRSSGVGGAGAGGAGFGVRGRGDAEMRGGRMRFNLVASLIDTAASVVATNTPTIQYLTEDGDWALQRKAKLRTRVLQSQGEDSGLNRLGPRVFHDGGTLGTGVTYLFLDPVTFEPRAERVLPMEILVDPAESLAGEVRTIYRQKLVDRAVLAALFPEAQHQKAIKDAQGPSAVDDLGIWLQRDTTLDQVVVTTAHRVPSRPVLPGEEGKTKTDGREVIAISSGTLLDKEYPWPLLPYACFRYKERPLDSFWGIGIAEQARDAQWRLSRLIKRSERLMDNSNAWIMADERTKVRIDKLTQQAALIVRYRGGGDRPTVQTFSATPQDIPQEVDRITSQTMRMLGISEAQAAGDTPVALQSGAALRAHEDQGARRFMETTKAFERYWLDAYAVLAQLNDIAQAMGKDPKIAMRVRRGRSEAVKSIDWSSVKIPGDRHRVRIFPASMLPTTPSGKLDQIQELIAGGMISQPFAKALLDWPDLDAAMAIEGADLDAVLHDVDQILEEGKAIKPQPLQALDFAAEVARKAYLVGKNNGAPEKNLELLRAYIDEAVAMVKQAQDEAQAEAEQAAIAAQQAQAAAGAAAPQGNAGQSPGVLPDAASAPLEAAQ